MQSIGVIGFGEVGGILAADLRGLGATVRAFDVAEGAQARAVASGMGAGDAAEVCRGAEAVFVCVTAGSVMEAMRSVAGHVGHGCYVVDVNSVSPGTKQEGAALIGASGGRYVEAAVMASVPPKRLKTPMLLGGAHAGAFMRDAAAYGMDLTDFSPEVGRASSVKMCRSVMIKGMEALATECLLSARHYGVEADVLRTMGDTLPHADWPGLARYMISRSLIHGKRRAEEMREVARTVRDAGVEPLAAEAIVARQDWAWRRGAEMGAATKGEDLGALLDALTATYALPKAAE